MAHPSVDQLGIGLAQPAIKERKNYVVDGPAGYMHGPAGYMHGPAGYMPGPAGYMHGPAGYMVGGPAGYILGPAGYMVAHEILVSAQGPLVLGLRVWGQGLTIIRKMIEMIKRDKSKIDDQ